MTPEFVWAIAVQTVVVVFAAGVLYSRIGTLAKEVDKLVRVHDDHGKELNSLRERIVRVESRLELKSEAH